MQISTLHSKSSCSLVYTIQCIEYHCRLLISTISQLGILIDTRLSWTPQINSLCSKANQLLRFLRRTLHHCSPHLKEHACKQNLIVLSSIEYCSSISGTHTNKMLMHKLEMIQHCATRFVLNKPWRRNCRDSLTNMLLTLKWPSPEEQRKQSCLIIDYCSNSSMNCYTFVVSTYQFYLLQLIPGLTTL